MTTLVYDEGVKSLTIKHIPDDVLRKFKSWAAYKGLTLNDAIIEIMKEKGGQMQVKEDEK
jgi:NRPS condensation-like uncharacterized protein